MFVFSQLLHVTVKESYCVCEVVFTRMTEADTPSFIRSSYVSLAAVSIMLHVIVENIYYHGKSPRHFILSCC